MIDKVDQSKCPGCHACYISCPNKCISMEQDFEGFLYPKIDIQACSNCNLCERSCPVLLKKQVDNQPVAYAAFNKDETVRLNSSSGGVFTLLAEEVLSQGGIVFGACIDHDFNVVHDYVDKIENISNFRGSKYVQSNIGDTYEKVKEYLKNSKLVLFSGTPCQIGGLKSYLKREYGNLICQDIICHGVPSPKVWRKYIAFREKCAESKTKRIAFRRKDEGWKRYSVSFLFNNGTEYRQTLDKDLYMKAFLQNVCLRRSCYNCSFKTMNRESDITLADFWGIQNILPEMDDDKGTSLIIINSNKGYEIFKEVMNHIVYKQVDIKEAIKYNTAAVKSASQNPNREKFFHALDQYEFDKLVGKYCSDSLLSRSKRKIRRIISKIKKMIAKTIT